MSYNVCVISLKIRVLSSIHFYKLEIIQLNCVYNQNEEREKKKKKKSTTATTKKNWMIDAVLWLCW